MKAFTSLEQSKKIAEILPIESADMYYAGHQSIINPKEWEYGDTPKIRGKYISFDDKRIFYPCWSLSALLEEIPEIINFDDESDYALEMLKENNLYYLSYGNPLEHSKIEIEPQEYFVDACVDMIDKLHELKML